MNQVRNIVRANGAHKQGITGREVRVAILDTGLSPHPDYCDRIRGWYDAINDHPLPYDDSGHGTHVAGIVAGNGYYSGGRYTGIAPGADLVGIKVLDHRGDGNIPHIIKGINWILRNQLYLNIRIVNISIGANDPVKFHENSLFVKKVEQLWNSGIVVVTAAGNRGPDRYSISAPGNSRKVITVGSSDIPRHSYGGPQNVNHSGVGPTLACIRKPDIVAPGSQIVSCSPVAENRQPYSVKSGTSMSTPVVSGAVALLLQKSPDLTPKKIKIRLKNSSTDLHLPHERQGWGLLNIQNLL